MEQPNHYYDLAKFALEHYLIDDWDLHFLRHNENLTYRVVDRTRDASYLLRIHFPRHAGFRGLQQSRLAIESELQWLHALKRDTDLLVQQPLHNRQDEFVTMLTGQPDAPEIPCTMLTWIDARLFSQDDSQAATWANRLGELNARLHTHARGWTPDPPFLRLSYDAPLLRGALARLETGIQLGVITPQDAGLVAEAGEYILDLLQALPRNRETWGLVHADLMGGNLLVQGESLIPIDFSLSGNGFFLLDMSICLSNLKQPLRKPYLAGYGGALDDDQHHVIDTCTIMMILVSALRHVENPEWRSWFQRRFPLIAQKYCPMLLRKQEFIFEI